MSATRDRRRLSPLTVAEINNTVVEVHNRHNSLSDTPSTPVVNLRTRHDKRRSSKTDDNQVQIEEVTSSPTRNISRRSSKTDYNPEQSSIVDISEASIDDPIKRVQKTRESWVESDLNVSAEGDLQIHNQIKQGIMGFMENEIKKSDSTKHPITTLSAYVNSMTESEENLKNKSSSRPSSGHKERKSPSRRKKKRISSKHRSDLGSDFDITISSMSALEKVDDYLKEYNKTEEVTLSGELEIDPNDLVNNNGSSKESKLKPRRTRRKSRHEDGKRDRGSNSRDISPRVFDPSTGKHVKSPNTKPIRPTLDLTSMLDDLGSDVTSYNERHIDNPFSSPSPMTSPNDGTLDRVFGSRAEKIYVQRGGTFRAVARDRVLGEAQRRADERKYFRLSSLTPLDIAITTQGGWRGIATLCHGLLGGLCLMHLLSICYSDGSNPGHLSFHSAVVLPYSAAYYFLCVCCLVSVFDSIDMNSFSNFINTYPYVKSILLCVIYGLCLLLTLSGRKYDEFIAFYNELNAANTTNLTNTTMPTRTEPPDCYSAWSNLSIWRAILPIMAAAMVAIVKQEDTVYRDLTKLLQFKHSLQSIGG